MSNEAVEELARKLCEMEGWKWGELDEVHRHFYDANTQSDYMSKAKEILKAGYKKVPELKGLSEEDLPKIVVEYSKKDTMTEILYRLCLAISQDTVEKINKQIEDENK